MNRLAQALLYGAFALCVGYFSVAPSYDYADPGVATIKLSLSHAANRVEECVKLTPQQINERATKGLPLNECGRERLPVTVELEIDGARALLVTAAPSGLWNDGPASVYERLDVAPGTHTITVRLRDSNTAAITPYPSKNDTSADIRLKIALSSREGCHHQTETAIRATPMTA